MNHPSVCVFFTQHCFKGRLYASVSPAQRTASSVLFASLEHLSAGGRGASAVSNTAWGSENSFPSRFIGSFVRIDIAASNNENSSGHLCWWDSFRFSKSHLLLPAEIGCEKKSMRPCFDSQRAREMKVAEINMLCQAQAFDVCLIELFFEHGTVYLIGVAALPSRKSPMIRTPLAF